MKEERYHIALDKYDKNIVINGITVEKLSPLIGKYAADAAQCCFNKTHNKTPFGYL